MCANQADFPGRMKECPLGRTCRNFRPRPPTPKGETVKTISLGDGYYAYVDAADYEWLSKWKWHLCSGYAVRYEKGKLLFMHRETMKPPEGMIVDHKNRNKLDNTREGLRICTQQENTRNAGKIQGTYSRFKGVSYRKERDKYFGQVYCEGEQYYLGLYADEIDAARAYDLTAVALFGEFARINFPEEWTPQRRRKVYAQRDAVLGRFKKRRAKARARRTEGKGQRTTKGKNKTSRAETSRRGVQGRDKKSERKTKPSRATSHRSRGTGRKKNEDKSK